MGEGRRGRYLHYPVDRYLDEFPFWFEWAGIRIETGTGRSTAYMAAFLQRVQSEILRRTCTGVR